MSPQPIPVITGMGCLCAQGFDLNACVKKLFGEPNLPHSLSVPGGPTRPSPVFAVPESVRASFVTDSDMRYSSLSTLFAKHSAWEALTNAGFHPEELAGRRIGVSIGTSVGASVNLMSFYRNQRAGRDPELFAVQRWLAVNPALWLARHFDVHGPCQTVVNACASGTDAIGLGAAWIRQGLCDVVLAGGTDELSEFTMTGFGRLLIVDENPVKPFDADRQGLNLGEGAGMVVLESEQHAAMRGAQARAMVQAYATAGDAYHPTKPHPEGRGLAAALTQAADAADLKVTSAAFINTHGTGTKDNDAVESCVYGNLCPDVPLCATKGYTGHTLGAAGAIEAIFTVVSLEQGALPGNTRCSTPDPALPVHPVTHTTSITGNWAISTSLAFGGVNSVLFLSLGDGI
ncbi:beta-ketoacyl-[acyl-carrier-protein] synthase family protein [Desulfovibrio inopinatus]|uniref:beta-ketoacyl-[acyl-carrier-protein] synthase family protein n=1 Tax=Desulfovibrio inopinatus TaxID=102109 RepID=UPI00040E243A|nr:beta-ketoacyl-[acyl-carrier-protein] synthase family protein [Desulfovibrio inopinatus]